MKTSPYCKKRHGTPNGACNSFPVPDCKICGQKNLDNHNWYCPNCFRCLECEKVVEKFVKDGELPEIPSTILVDPHRGKDRIRIPKFTHSKEVCRVYRFSPVNNAYVSDRPTGIVLKGEQIGQLLNGNLNLLR